MGKNIWILPFQQNALDHQDTLCFKSVKWNLFNNKMLKDAHGFKTSEPHQSKLRTKQSEQALKSLQSSVRVFMKSVELQALSRAMKSVELPRYLCCMTSHLGFPTNGVMLFLPNGSPTERLEIAWQNFSLNRSTMPWICLRHLGKEQYQA